MAGSDQLIPVLLNPYLLTLKKPDFENDVPYMYVDSEGYVTVGVGHNLTTGNDLADTIAFVVAKRQLAGVEPGHQRSSSR